MPTKTKARRDANRIVEICDRVVEHKTGEVQPGATVEILRDAINIIRPIADGIDASTGKRDKVTKPRRRAAARKGRARRPVG